MAGLALAGFEVGASGCETGARCRGDCPRQRGRAPPTMWWPRAIKELIDSVPGEEEAPAPGCRDHHGPALGPSTTASPSASNKRPREALLGGVVRGAGGGCARRHRPASGGSSPRRRPSTTGPPAPRSGGGAGRRRRRRGIGAQTSGRREPRTPAGLMGPAGARLGGRPIDALLLDYGLTLVSFHPAHGGPAPGPRGDRPSGSGLPGRARSRPPRRCSPRSTTGCSRTRWSRHEASGALDRDRRRGRGAPRLRRARPATLRRAARRVGRPGSAGLVGGGRASARDRGHADGSPPARSPARSLLERPVPSAQPARAARPPWPHRPAR